MSNRRASRHSWWLLLVAGCGGSTLDESTGATDCQNVIASSCNAAPTGIVDVGSVQRADAGSVCDPTTAAASSTACRTALANLSAEAYALDQLGSAYDGCVTGGGTGAAMDVTCLCAVAVRYRRDFAAAGSPVATYANGTLPAGRNAVAPYGSTMTRVTALCGAAKSDAGSD